MKKDLIKAFTNEQFGNVRVVLVGANQQPYFVGKDVAECLGYSDLTHCITDHVDEEDRVNSKTQGHFNPEFGQRGTWLINESGLYSLILSSKLPSAKEFKRWVTGSVLPSIRKTGQYDAFKDVSPELQAILMHDKKIQSIEHQVTDTGIRLEKLENKMVVDYGQAQELTKIARMVIVNALGGKSSLAYKKLSKRAFSEFWRDYKQCFGVDSYRNTPAVEFEHAKQLMYQWQPSNELKALIAWEQQAPLRNLQEAQA